jgi:hypothetical protein
VKWGSSGAFLPDRERKGGGWSGVAQGGGSRGGVRCCAHVERKGVRHRQWHRSGGGSGRSGTCRMKRVKSWVHGTRLLWARPTRNSKFFNLFKRKWLDLIKGWTPQILKIAIKIWIWSFLNKEQLSLLEVFRIWFRIWIKNQGWF